MEIKSIANFATYSNQERVQQEVKLAIYKQSLDVTKSVIGNILESVQAPPKLPAHLGNSVNTTA